jgi:hypothetical protein
LNGGVLAAAAITCTTMVYRSDIVRTLAAPVARGAGKRRDVIEGDTTGQVDCDY